MGLHLAGTRIMSDFQAMAQRVDLLGDISMTVDRGQAIRATSGPRVIVGPCSLLLQGIGHGDNMAELVVAVGGGQHCAVSAAPVFYLGGGAKKGTSLGGIVVFVFGFSHGCAAGAGYGLADDLADNIYC